jgi:hypothetical protein
MGKNGRILFDRPKPTVGCSASGRRRRIVSLEEAAEEHTAFLHTLYMTKT